jgi:hypothetical protein
VRQPTQPSFGAARAGPMSHGEAEILNALAEPDGRGPRVRPRRMDPMGLASPLPPIFPALPLRALAGNLLGGSIVSARQPASVSSACVGKLFYPLKFTFWMPG